MKTEAVATTSRRKNNVTWHQTAWCTSSSSGGSNINMEDRCCLRWIRQAQPDSITLFFGLWSCYLYIPTTQMLWSFRGVLRLKRVSYQWRRARTVSQRGVWRCKLSMTKGGKGRQLGRHLSEEQAERSIHEHFGHISRDVMETKKVRGLVLRDQIRQDKMNMKQHNSRCRLGAL